MILRSHFESLFDRMDHREPKTVLAGLVSLALVSKDWTPEDAAEFAKSKGLGRLSPNNIRAYAEGERKHIKPRIVRAFEQVFEVPINSWFNQVFSKDRAHFLLRTKIEVLQEQQQLAKDDEVWIISSRDFLEAADVDIKRLVCSALRKGVVYRYFFPSKKARHRYGTSARDSYQSFRAHIRGEAFDEPPQIFGFALDPSNFSFFSELHTVVRYRKIQSDTSSTYCFIEIGDEGEGKTARWYRLPAEIWSQIQNELEGAMPLIADSELDEVMPINRRLRAVAERYAAWFDNRVNADHYSKLRNLIAHSADRCVGAIVNRLLRADVKSPKNGWRYLDIGCGDGMMTHAIMKALAEAGRSTLATIVDPSKVQLKLAKENLHSFGNTTAREQTFEDFIRSGPRGEFEVITAIHSLYTVDDAFLPRIYDLLAPGGVACIWMGTLAENVVNSLSQRLDETIKYGQKRNYAEDVYRIVGRSTLKEPERVSNVGYLGSEAVVDASREQAIFKFCALQNVDTDIHHKASEIWTQIRQQYSEKLPMTDLLITLERPATR